MAPGESRSAGDLKPIAVHAFNPSAMTGEGNWTWLIPGRVPTLIDAGDGDPRHLDAVASALSGDDLAQVVVTHGHSDHASGAVAIAERMPGVRFLKMPWPERDSRWRVPWRVVRDGDTIRAGDTLLSAVHTPGHAPDHVCLWHRDTRTIFGGDLAITGTTVYIPPAPHGDLAAYLSSLERVLALNPVRILPAHGPVVDEPGLLLHRYLAHRREREKQIIEAVRDGDAGLEAIVSRIYSGLSDELLPRARATVRAHLEKLEREGRATCRDEVWHMIER
jgi:glyoxylase-like metal-dependent hydrolase (beta-lactamase superfamily II)